MRSAQSSRHGLWRSRWAAIGAAVAVTFGAGGVVVASAADSAPSTFVSVTPVRVVDSRLAVGLAGPLVAGEPEVVQITGTIPTADGPLLVVPADATAVVANVTAVSPTAAGFISVRSGDSTGVPATSSLNFNGGQTVPNSVTIQLTSAGNLQAYYGAAGSAPVETVDLLLDVVGYYVAGSGGGGSGAASSQFFALMPPDNAATVAPGTDVSFPQDGPIMDGSIIARTGPSSFSLEVIGTYRVSYQVPVTEAGQLILTLNGADLAYTVAGRATGTSQITATVLVETTLANSILTVRNPAGNNTSLTITPLAGGTRPVSASLLIDFLGQSPG